ncbi:unnamed protein product [Rotaria magnacalcarata]|uniref:Uncharacterized protein n=2 Tax=Rotaria magnacalcarata TaxID=392030 RepID=A0A815XZK4_9BILA|nr:unnamed protein product [Rotaria magnacalcarata]CAF1564566.1 unnamed protein product [Rotaria magnacalcarata]CAF2146759.1 unnamed protein product [Rotaria magnacalcarata]CAF3985458.1 unnamed protein product [Rotaria magnacalcarata]CAF4140655.1 unnamed protein product [Rotaria magnacalcarata]
MGRSHEQKTNIVHRILNSTLKFIQENITDQSKLSVGTLNYELPDSFFKAVDHARRQAGYDVLPRVRNRSVPPPSSRHNSCSSLSSLSSERSHNDHQPVSKIYQSSSGNNLDTISQRKIQFRRTNRQRQPTTNQRLFSSRPPVRMIINPRFMIASQFRRPQNVIPIRPQPVFMQQRPVFRLRFQ